MALFTQYCDPTCTQKIPVYLIDKCKIKFRQGGLCYFVIRTCSSATPTDLCDVASWQALGASCDVRISPRITGSLSEPSYASEYLNSCTQKQTTMTTYSFEFMDYNMSESLSNYDLYEYIGDNQSNLQIAFIGSDGRVYPFEYFTWEGGEIIEDHQSKKSYFKYKISMEFSGYKMLKPTTQIADLPSILTPYMSYDCATSQYLVDQFIDCSQLLVTVSAAQRDITTSLIAIDPNVDLIFGYQRINCAASVIGVLSNLPVGVTYVPPITTIGSGPVTITLLVNVSLAIAGVYTIGITATGADTCGVSDNYVTLTITA